MKREMMSRFSGSREHLGHNVVMVDDALGALVKGEARASPDGSGGVHFHGVVSFDRGAVGVVDLDGSGREGGIRVAAVAGNVRATRSSDCWHGIGEIGVHVGLVGVVLDADGSGSGIGLGECFGNGKGDVLSPVAHGIVRERRAVLAGAAPGAVAEDAAGVAVMQNEEDAGKFLCG